MAQAVSHWSVTAGTPLLEPGPVRVRFVVDRVTLRKASVRLLRSVPDSLVPSMLHVGRVAQSV
jgi:hypothetical protein